MWVPTCRTSLGGLGSEVRLPPRASGCLVVPLAAVPELTGFAPLELGTWLALPPEMILLGGVLGLTVGLTLCDEGAGLAGDAPAMGRDGAEGAGRVGARDGALPLELCVFLCAVAAEEVNSRIRKIKQFRCFAAAM